MDSLGKKAGKGPLVFEEISGTLQTNQDQYLFQSIQSEVTYDARGNGNGGVVGTITGDHENRITDYTNLIVFNKKRRAQSSEDFETWVQGGAANTLNTFDNSDVRATTVIIEGGVLGDRQRTDQHHRLIR